MLITNMNDPPSLWRNDTRNGCASIFVKLIGSRSNRSALGARVRVAAGGRTQIGEVHSGDSVMSMGDLRLHFGLGAAQKIDRLEVLWPATSKVQEFRNLDVNQIITIREGSGITQAAKLAPGKQARRANIRDREG